MTTQELLHTFALDVQEGMSDDQIGEQAEHLAKKIEALVRKETVEEILKLPTTQQLHNDGTLDEPKISEYEIISYAQSKGITL